jgi:hypothetical protein
MRQRPCSGYPKLHFNADLSDKWHTDRMTGTEAKAPAVRSASDAQVFAFPAPWAWWALAALAVLDAIWIAATDFRVVGTAFTLQIILASLALGVAWWTGSKGGDDRIRLLFLSSAFLMYLNVAVRIFNYLSTSLALPLIDAQLAAADAILGFDWIAYLAFANERPYLARTFDIFYQAPLAFSAILCVFLALTRQQEQLREFLILFLATLFFTLAVGAVWPALDAFVYYQPAAELRTNILPTAGVYHMQFVPGLRDGSLRIIDFDTIEGLTTFPSFHTIEGVILVWCARGMRWLFVPTLVATVLMLASTPINGGHYAVDLIAGAAVALVAIAVYHRAAWPVRSETTETALPVPLPVAVTTGSPDRTLARR